MNIFERQMSLEGARGVSVECFITSPILLVGLRICWIRSIVAASPSRAAAPQSLLDSLDSLNFSHLALAGRGSWRWPISLGFGCINRSCYSITRSEERVYIDVS